jgi:CRP-like cAMP-binding protein
MSHFNKKVAVPKSIFMSSRNFNVGPALQSLLLANSVNSEKSVGSFLFQQGEPSIGVYLLLSGVVNLYLTGEGRSRVLTRQANSGELLGLPATVNNAPYSLTAEAGTELNVAFVSSEKLTGLITSDSEIGLEVIQLLSTEVRAMRDLLANPIDLLKV